VKASQQRLETKMFQGMITSYTRQTLWVSEHVTNHRQAERLANEWRLANYPNGNISVRAF
jgi:hypothetical protein